jgi:hypothetical protein
MFKSLIFSTALICATSCAYAQTPLSAYADPDGYILVKKLTCAQLAGTFQEDANFLGVWYSGWYNGLGKKSALNVPRVREGGMSRSLLKIAKRSLRLETYAASAI